MANLAAHVKQAKVLEKAARLDHQSCRPCCDELNHPKHYLYCVHLYYLLIRMRCRGHH